MPSSVPHLPINESATPASRRVAKPYFHWSVFHWSVFHSSILLTGVMAFLSFTAGCQTFHPFAQRTREKISSAGRWANNGLEAFQNGHLDQAKGLFSRASEQNPNDYRIRANLARTLHQSGDSEQAIAEMTQAVELSHNDPKMLITLGQMYLEMGRSEPAQQQVELALSSNHRFAPAWELSGRIAKSKGDFPSALADFQKSLGYAPDITSVQMEIVDTYQRMGEPLRALSAVEQVLSKHSFEEQPESTLIAKSVALIELKHLSPAIELLQAASQRDGASSDLFLRLGHAQLLAGDTAGSRSTVDRGQRAFPNLPVFQQLAQTLTSPNAQKLEQLERNAKSGAAENLLR